MQNSLQRKKMKNKRDIILLADNEPNFLNVRAEFLEGRGYKVLKAFSLKSAKELLNEEYIHLAILDIRLVDDDDEKDVSGLTLAKESAFRSIPKIILTGFPSISAVKNALGPTFDGLPPAIDFIDKVSGVETLIQAVEKAFDQFAHINWDLSVYWNPREPLSFLHLVSLLEPELPNDILLYRAGELEDLIRQLFYNYQQIRLGQLLWHDRSRFCLPVWTQSDMTTDFRILICGKRDFLERERVQIKKVAPDTLQGTRLVDQAKTTHFGAHLYALLGANIDTIQTLWDLLQVSKDRQLRTAFTSLLDDTLKTWHQHGQMVQEKQDLMSIYRQWAGLPNEKIQLEQQLESLIQSARLLGVTEISCDNHLITFHFSRQTPQHFPDPIETVYSPLAHYNVQAICKLSPGNLRTESILVDSGLRPWLTDFSAAGQAPHWWDFVCLEAAVRFDISQAPDLIAWQDFEECLIRPTRLDDHLEQNEVITELRTNISVIEQIRRQASSETGPDLIPYYAGLLAWIIGVISQYDPGILSTQADKLRSAHLLLAACMLSKRLSTIIDIPSLNGNGELRLDDEGRVWIGERYVTTLSGLRLKLFGCLYEYAGQSVSNRMIIEKVYGELFNPRDRDQNQRIRQEIRRIREEIEPKPDQPRYILTVREKGYRLQISGEPEK
jgi:DNA-binding response OmpR family regulator